jgi:hypothetical protein
MRDGRLGEVKQGHKLTHAHLSGVLAQNVDELQPYWIAERLGDLRHSIGFVALNVGIDDRLTATLARQTLDLRS